MLHLFPAENKIKKHYTDNKSDNDTKHIEKIRLPHRLLCNLAI